MTSMNFERKREQTEDTERDGWVMMPRQDEQQQNGGSYHRDRPEGGGAMLPDRRNSHGLHLERHHPYSRVHDRIRAERATDLGHREAEQLPKPSSAPTDHADYPQPSKALETGHHPAEQHKTAERVIQAADDARSHPFRPDRGRAISVPDARNTTTPASLTPPTSSQNDPAPSSWSSPTAGDESLSSSAEWDMTRGQTLIGPANRPRSGVDSNTKEGVGSDGEGLDDEA